MPLRSRRGVASAGLDGFRGQRDIKRLACFAMLVTTGGYFADRACGSKVKYRGSRYASLRLRRHLAGHPLGQNHGAIASVVRVPFVGAWGPGRKVTTWSS